MIIKGIITVLNRQHPCAEQEPEYRGYRLANAGNKVEQQQHDGARQIPCQLLPLTLHNPRNIFHDAKDADVRRVAPVRRASSCSASRPLNGAAIQLAIVEKK